MGTSVTTRVGDRLGLDRTGVLWGLLLVDLEVLIFAGYLLFENVRISDPFILVFPFLWINVALWAIASTRVPTVADRTRYVGLAIAAGYFLVLAYVGGVIGLGHAFHGHAHFFGARWAWPLPPGWGPAFIYSGTWIQVQLAPYKVIGYAALAYLVYATLLDAAGSAVVGVVGLFSCVSCTWPVLGTIAAGLFGGASGASTAVLNQSYLLSTVVFLSSVALLKWVPTIRR